MNFETKSVSFAADGHPDEDQLLLTVERELSPEEMYHVEEHLGSCWSCRARSEDIRRGILAFVEYRERRYLPSLPGAPHDFGDFRRRLRNSIGVFAGPGAMMRVWRKIASLSAIAPQFRWMSVAAAMMVFVILWTQVLHPSVVSADELLVRAVAAQNPARTSGRPDTRLFRQRIAISNGRDSAVRDFEWRVGNAAPESDWAVESDVFHWGAPLSAACYAKWHNSLHKKEDRVHRSADLLTLDTRTAEGSLTEAWIVVRAGDFHPLEQHLRFRDQRQIDLKEIDFSFVEPLQTAAQVRPWPAATPAQASRSTESVISPVELNDVEMRVRYTLFAHYWDLGEDLLISRSDSRFVILSGTVSSPETEKAMLAALSGIRYAQLKLVAPGTSGQPAKPTRKSLRDEVPMSKPLLEDRLAATFPAPQERLEFVDACLTAADSELAHVWALRRLADRYGDSSQNGLSAEAKRLLQEMLRAHLRDLKLQNEALQTLLRFAPETAEQTATIPEQNVAATQQLFVEVQKQDELVTDLVTGSAARHLDADQTAKQFRSTHQTIAQLVDRLTKRFRSGSPQ